MQTDGEVYHVHGKNQYCENDFTTKQSTDSTCQISSVEIKVLWAIGQGSLPYLEAVSNLFHSTKHQVDLFLFLSSCHDRNLEWWTKRFKTTEKLQLSSAQADRSLLLDTPKTWEQTDPKSHQKDFSWFPPFHTSHILLLAVPCAKTRLVPTTSQDRECKQAYA